MSSGPLTEHRMTRCYYYAQERLTGPIQVQYARDVIAECSSSQIFCNGNNNTKEDSNRNGNRPLRDCELKTSITRATQQRHEEAQDHIGPHLPSDIPHKGYTAEA